MLNNFFFQSASAKRSGNYPKAKKYADLALALVVSNIIVTLCISLLVTGLIASYSSNRLENRNKCLYIEYFAHLRRWCKLMMARTQDEKLVMALYYFFIRLPVPLSLVPRYELNRTLNLEITKLKYNFVFFITFL